LADEESFPANVQPKILQSLRSLRMTSTPIAPSQ
jgi:hypothetical protein